MNDRETESERERRLPFLMLFSLGSIRQQIENNVSSLTIFISGIKAVVCSSSFCLPHLCVKPAHGFNQISQE